MEKLNFYNIDPKYVKFLQKIEYNVRGFTRVPNIEYAKDRKPKFLCGIVLQIQQIEYYVPVSSYKKQQADNFLIRDTHDHVVSSLRFNYMFPIPKGLACEKRISEEPDTAYRILLSQELRYCIRNQKEILYLAERTYKRVLLGKNRGLVVNSCDFKLLEQASIEYIFPQ